MITWILNQYGRVVTWIKTDHWCTGHVWGDWVMVDMGREKIRHCQCCGWMETTNHPWRGFLRRPR